MKEVSETTWSVQLIILFILIFACFLALVINYSNAYMIKNEALSIIEKYEGLTSESLNIINDMVFQKAYNNLELCPEGYYGVTDLESNSYTNDPEAAYYCFQDVEVNEQVYYNVVFFYRFNLPVVGQLGTFRVKGRTQTFIGNPDRIKVNG